MNLKWISAVAALLVPPALSVGDCGCSSCTSSVLDRDADGYRVRDRIDWVVANMGQNEDQACMTVCGDEFPDVCDHECNPSECGGGSGSGSCGGCSWDGGNDCPDWWCNESKSNCDVCTGTWYGGGGPPGGCDGCSWDGGKDCPDWWCNESKSNCNVCTGTWYGGRDPPGDCDGCSWDGGKDCPDLWCNGSKSNCDVCTGTWYGGGGGGGPSPGQTATTTRYWDCSGGACACSYIPTGLATREPVHCHSNAMFAAPSGNQYGAKFYGAAAISASLGGGDWMAEGCGKCWKVSGYSPITDKISTLVLKGTNFCPDANPLCAAGPHFDIAAPGFDVLSVSLANQCTHREPDEATGFNACSGWMINNQDPDANCNCGSFISPILRKGCKNFFGLKWDNPKVTYEEVACPPELSDLHCGFPYATEENMPDTCTSN